MKSKIIYSLVLLLILLIALEWTYGFFLRQNKNLKSSYVASEKINADVLIIGDCVPMYMHPPDEYIGLRSFNLATNHSSFAEHLAHFHLYLKNNIPPKFIFIYVNNKTMDGSFNTYNTFLFSQFLSDPLIDSITAVEDPEYYKLSYIPFMKYAFYNRFVNFNTVQGVSHFVKDKKKPYYDNGYIRLQNSEWDHYFERFARQYPNGKKFDWSMKEESYLRRIISIAKERGITVIFYEPPVLGEILPYFRNKEEIRAKAISFANDLQVDYWRFDTMSISDSREYFFTIFNTNGKGSVIFTKALSKKFNEVYGK